MQIGAVEYSPRGFLINVLQGPRWAVGVPPVKRKQKKIINMRRRQLYVIICWALTVGNDKLFQTIHTLCRRA